MWVLGDLMVKYLNQNLKGTFSFHFFEFWLYLLCGFCDHWMLLKSRILEPLHALKILKYFLEYVNRILLTFLWFGVCTDLCYNFLLETLHSFRNFICLLKGIPKDTFLFFFYFLYNFNFLSFLFLLALIRPFRFLSFIDFFRFLPWLFADLVD